jgi:cAMP phosphodiesterase
VLLTHSHLDHIATLPFLVDQDQEMNGGSMNVHCLPQTAAALREHLLNGKIWPDLEAITIKNRPWLVIHEVAPFAAFRAAEREFTALPVEHAVPTAAFALHGEQCEMVYVADMFDAPPAFWEWLQNRPKLRYLIIEAAFPNRMRALAEVSKHLTPETLAERLQKIPDRVAVFAGHLKPSYAAEISRELAAASFPRRVTPLVNGQEFDL